jgi:RNA polymerase sigma factor (sigma-70 family)
LKPTSENFTKNRALFDTLRRLESEGDERGATRVKSTIVETNLALVYWYANRYRWVVDEGRMEMGDLVGAGVVGLYKAIEKFDVSKGFTFSTYARFWIRSHVDRAAQGGDVVHVYRGWLPRGSMKSLDAPVGKEHGGSMTRHEVIDSHSDTPESLVVAEEEREAVGHACRLVGGRMGERAAIAMRKRFEGNGQTYRKIAADEGVTWQCIHLREKRFVERVRREMRRTG